MLRASTYRLKKGGTFAVGCLAPAGDAARIPVVAAGIPIRKVARDDSFLQATPKPWLRAVLQTQTVLTGDMPYCTPPSRNAIRPSHIHTLPGTRDYDVCSHVLAFQGAWRPVRLHVRPSIS